MYNVDWNNNTLNTKNIIIYLSRTSADDVFLMKKIMIKNIAARMFHRFVSNIIKSIVKNNVKLLIYPKTIGMDSYRPIYQDLDWNAEKDVIHDDWPWKGN